MTRARQEQALCALVETLFAVERSPEEHWPDIFEALRKVLNFSSAVFIPIDPVNWALQPGYSHDAPNLIAEYLAHYQGLDPYVTAATPLKSFNTPIRFSDIADISRLAQGEFGAFMRQVPYFHAMAAVPLLQGCPFGVLSIHRRREQPDFDREDMDLFGWFARQVARAIDYARLRRRFDNLSFRGHSNKLINFQYLTPPPPPHPRKLLCPVRESQSMSPKPLSEYWRCCPRIGASPYPVRANRPLSGLRPVRSIRFTAIPARRKVCFH
ncbi:MAG: GAF domain-containing protein [Candidatus Competibacteraceae bacterium]